tara:strand:- start:3504 stop:3842 length:339 start_codon:yes stop_codon:yes gene_type:complete
MPAGTLNLTVEQGATFVNNMTANVDGSTDITNFTFTSQVRTEAISDHILATFTVTKTNNSTGEFNISLTDTQTASLPVGTHKWDLVFVNSADSSRTRLLEGNCTVTAQVTRS